MSSDEFRRRSPPSGGREEHKLFIGGIPHKFRDRDLKDAFRRYDASRATVMIDRKSGRSRGFGFVYFFDRRQCDEAIARMHEAVLEGRKISVNRAVPETQTVPGTPAGLLAAGGGGRGGGGSLRERDRSRDRDRDRSPRGSAARGERREGDRWARSSSSARREFWAMDGNRGSRGTSGGGPSGVRGQLSSQERSRRRSYDRSTSPRARDASYDGDSRDVSLERDVSGPPAYSDASHYLDLKSEPAQILKILAEYKVYAEDLIEDYVANIDPKPPLYPHTLPSSRSKRDRSFTDTPSHDTHQAPHRSLPPPPWSTVEPTTHNRIPSSDTERDNDHVKPTLGTIGGVRGGGGVASEARAASSSRRAAGSPARRHTERADTADHSRYRRDRY